MKNLIGIIVFLLVCCLAFSSIAGNNPKKIRKTPQMFTVGAVKQLEKKDEKNGFKVRNFKREKINNANATIRRGGNKNEK